MNKAAGILAAAVLAIGGAVSLSSAQAPATAPPAVLTRAAGYLGVGRGPNSLTLLPPPPAAGSAALARDEEASQAALKLYGGPRWDLATEDADLSFPKVAGTFSCALGIEISEASTPRLYTLMRRSLSDIGLSTYPTKTKYQRPRPFMANGAPICTPAVEASLRRDGSYPSGHSAVGWGWGLIMAQVAPDRADAVLARGRAFSHSRVVCNVHYLADVEEGRTMGAATVAKLNASSEFRADVEAARAEVAAASAKGSKPTRDCARETAQMADG